MPINIMKRIQDFIRDGVQSKDYIIYLILNPFKFKPLPKTIKRILIIELLNIGDIITITPAIRALKHHYKQVKIDVLVKPAMKEVLKGNPHITNIITYKGYKRTKQEIKQKNYDLGFLFHPGSWKASMLLFSGKVKYRIGGTKTGIWYGKGFFLNKKIFPNNTWQHKIDDILDVIKAVKIEPKDKQLEIYTTKKAETKIKKYLKGKKKPIIGINAASSHWTQQWYPKKFAEVANNYITKSKATIIFTGTKNEKYQVEEIIKHVKKKKNILNLCGKTSFQELIALIKHLNLFLTIDSGATHIASALNTPTVTLFGPTIPTFWGPTGKNSSYIWKEKKACVGCRRYTCVYNKNHECMKSITPQEVMKESKKLLKR
jgi:heptosyltransferase II